MIFAPLASFEGEKRRGQEKQLRCFSEASGYENMSLDVNLEHWEDGYPNS